MVGRARGDRIGPAAGALHVVQGLLPALLELDAEALLDQANVGTQDARQQDVATRSYAPSYHTIEGCLECHVVTGEFDYFLMVRTRDLDSFNELHARQLLRLPGVRQIRSFMVLKQVLSTTQVPV